ncbi:ABC transporter permease [Salinadaptatus halalkaliphilus]|uniref:ABC transporter permease n=1 Tax=Salinadaptatus halalkaliphilus TaxID=2419781 RepID=A0A4S3TPB9_9EURY|nr:ABC transporter permease [Salinadaptatus halalkaliphilus]THE65063.1 ABC transporter permease [Salinadaptatus halalkaliphilus]
MLNRKYLLQRLALMGISLFIVVTLLFFLFRQIPGGPTAMMAPGALPEDVRQQVIEEHGLNEPLWRQYVLFMTNLVQGDLGYSFYYGQPVSSMIASRVVNTLALMISAILISYTLGIYLGAHLGWIRGTTLERVEMVIVLIARSTPVFFMGLFLLYIFSFQLGWFPVGGMRSVGASADGAFQTFFSIDFFHHLVLPVVSLSLFYTGLPLLLMRNNMLEVITEEYIETAQAKGLSRRRIVFVHAARNAILPVVTAFAVAIGFSIGGQVLIETVFSWPGLGREMVDSATRNDYPMAQGTFLLLATLVITMNFVADILYTYLDPRVSVDGESE